MSEIHWVNPLVELPKADKCVALMINSAFDGGKWPDTFEIIFGKTYLQWNQGKHKLYVTSNFIGDTKVEAAVAWAYAKEFEKPEFLRKK